MYVVFFLCALFLTSSVFARKVILVSDIDDTIKRTHVLGYLTGGPFSKNAYQGMSDLYLQFACSPIVDPERREFCLAHRAFFRHPDRRVYYLTAAYGIWTNFGRNFLVDSNFPAGPFIHKPERGESNFEFKVRSLQKLIEAYPQNTDFVLVGDNSQADGEAYAAVMEHYREGPQRIYSYIHQVYSYADTASEQGKPIPVGVERFQTAFELALEFYQRGWIHRKEVLGVYETVAKYLFSNDEDMWKQVVPKWTRCLEFLQEYHIPSGRIDAQLHAFLLKILRRLELLCRFLDGPEKI